MRIGVLGLGQLGPRPWAWPGPLTRTGWKTAAEYVPARYELRVGAAVGVAVGTGVGVGVGSAAIWTVTNSG